VTEATRDGSVGLTSPSPSVEDDQILVEIEPPVATIVLNRPEKRNALTLEMWRKLPELVRRLDADPSVRVIVLRGSTPTAFAAGADISEFESLRSTPELITAYNGATASAEDALATCSKPTVAAVRGYCVGGGCEIAVACDFRFADQSARFGVTPARLGIVYAAGATRRLAQLVGVGPAKLLLLSAQLIDVEEALRIGLVTRVLPADSFDADVDAFVGTLARNSLVSMSGAKSLLHALSEDLSEETLARAAGIVAKSFGSDDYREGVRAFLERRPPRFT
jgi:enoyl-CoA hydratase